MRLQRTIAAVAAVLGLTVLTAPAHAQTMDPHAAWRPFLECTIDHESRSAGIYETNTGNGYYGAFQFLFSTWSGAIWRAGYPLLAGDAPVAPLIDGYWQEVGAIQLASEAGAAPWGGRCANLLP